MMEAFSRIANLIEKYFIAPESLTNAEIRQLNEWRALSEDNQELFEKLSDRGYVEAQSRLKGESDLDRAWGRVQTRLWISASENDLVAMAMGRRRQGWKDFAIAASLVGATLYAGLDLLKKPLGKNQISASISRYGNDVLPGLNKATLTLGDGSTVQLTGLSNGTIATQGNTRIEKLDNGRLLYDQGLTGKGGVTYNTLTTARGEQYQLILSDGTKVWLNNATALRYPTRFSGSSRVIGLEGEAYFEIAESANKPFFVKVGAMEVEVLGTHFNIMAYKDEAVIKTTLLEGRLRVDKGRQSILLRPGEQASLNLSGDSLMLVRNADVDEAIAWKNGLFHFDRADIRTVMRTLARWYDVDVKYEGAITDHQYGGDIQRDLKLSQVLDIFQKNGVHFDIQDKTITVRP